MGSTRHFHTYIAAFQRWLNFQAICVIILITSKAVKFEKIFTMPYESAQKTATTRCECG